MRHRLGPPGDASCRYYVEARLQDQEALIRSIEEVLDGSRRTLAPEPPCTCPEGDHPELPGTEAAAELGVYLLSEEGRAAYAEEYEPDEAPAVYDCEMFLSDVLADASYQLP